VSRFPRLRAGRLLAAILRRRRHQVAALCWRPETEGIRLLLLTSRETRRWVIPKGWPQPGLDAAGTAREEAWEEGGVRLDGDGRHLGSYTYDKRLRGASLPVEVEVFAFRVTGMEDDFPEAGQRERVWVTPAEAARRVQEPSLSRLLTEAGDRLAGSADAAREVRG